jgi:pimeloyl-ACP methyl ester carboxylesterase
MSNLRSILVVHGALGSAAQMQPVAEVLRTLGNVVVVELPGHGETPLPEDTSFGMGTFADAIAAEVARLQSVAGDAGIPVLAPVVFGYSMGGYAALALEARDPGRLAGIVTLGTKFEWTPEVAEKESSRLDPTAIAAKVPKFAETLGARHAGAGGWEIVLLRTAALLRDLGESTLLSPSALAGISIPVCIAVGSRDDTVTAQEAERVAGTMKDATTTVLPDVPHPIERVPPETIVGLMRELLSRVQ